MSRIATSSPQRAAVETPTELQPAQLVAQLRDLLASESIDDRTRANILLRLLDATKQLERLGERRESPATPDAMLKAIATMLRNKDLRRMLRAEGLDIRDADL